MIARESHILKLLGGTDKSFFIPVYQREYSWLEENCSRLMQDIAFVVEHNLDSHFFGSIVYTNKELAGISSYCVIDGQQRVTTISLLLLAIFNEITDRENENHDDNGEEIISIDELKNAYFYVNPYKKNPDLKLTLTDDDNEVYRDLVQNGKVNPSTKIGRNYQFFVKSLKEKSVKEIGQIYNVLKHLAIVNVSLESNDDPQRIFESLNSKILPLLESDKIRNYIFMNVEYEDQKILYKDYWKPISENVSDISKLIRFYLVIKTNLFIPEKQLYFCFKDYMINNPELTSKQVLSAILKYSTYMKEVLQCSKNSPHKYQQCLYRLNKLDMSTIYPLVFICLDSLVEEKTSNLEINIADFDEIMAFIESYIARRNFLKLSTSSLNKIFAFLPAEIFKMTDSGSTFKDAVITSICSKTSNSRFPKDAEFKNAFVNFELYNAKSSFRKYVLERLENFNHKEIIDVDNDLAVGTLTIEHVMPQTLDDGWKEYLGEKHEQIHQMYLDTIGNLTLTAYNSEYSNLPFEKKKNLPNKGFQFSSLFLNEYIKSQSEWKESQIQKRAEIMLSRAMEIWGYPKVSFAEGSVFDINNPSTWKYIKITQFGREAFQYLFANNLLSQDDLEMLKNRESSKKLLGAYYPVLSNTREKGESGKTHWAKDVYRYNGEELYLTFEWFKEQFDLLSSYLKSKMGI